MKYPDDNEIVTVNGAFVRQSSRESGVNPEQFRCCEQGAGTHNATGQSMKMTASGKAGIGDDL